MSAVDPIPPPVYRALAVLTSAERDDWFRLKGAILASLVATSPLYAIHMDQAARWLADELRPARRIVH